MALYVKADLHLKLQLVRLEVLVVAEVGALHRVDELDGLLLVLLGLVVDHVLHAPHAPHLLVEGHEVLVRVEVRFRRFRGAGLGPLRADLCGNQDFTARSC